MAISPINTRCHAISSSTPPQSTGKHHPSSASEEWKHPHSRRFRAEHSCRPSRTRPTAGRERADVMSQGSKGGRAGALDLKLHLPPPAPAPGTERAASLSSDEEWCLSSPSSCLSSEGEREPQRSQQSHGLQWSDSPEATSMVLAACPRCLMYVMLSEADPRCPRCRSPVLLDFLHHAAAARNSSRRSIDFNVSREDDDHSRGGGGSGRNRRA